jgi:hypothetical protein
MADRVEDKKIELARFALRIEWDKAAVLAVNSSLAIARNECIELCVCNRAVLKIASPDDMVARGERTAGCGQHLNAVHSYLSASIRAALGLRLLLR